VTILYNYLITFARRVGNERIMGTSYVCVCIFRLRNCWRNSNIMYYFNSALPFVKLKSILEMAHGAQHKTQMW